jgi:hypothetical protein
VAHQAPDVVRFAEFVNDSDYFLLLVPVIGLVLEVNWSSLILLDQQLLDRLDFLFNWEPSYWGELREGETLLVNVDGLRFSY